MHVAHQMLMEFMMTGTRSAFMPHLHIGSDSQLMTTNRRRHNQGSQAKRLTAGQAKALSARNLTEETCREFDYILSHHNGEPVQAALYRDKSGRAVAQKVQTKDKRFHHW